MMLDPIVHWILTNANFPYKKIILQYAKSSGKILCSAVTFEIKPRIAIKRF